jgi:hypothetical protein
LKRNNGKLQNEQYRHPAVYHKEETFTVAATEPPLTDLNLLVCQLQALEEVLAAISECL